MTPTAQMKIKTAIRSILEAIGEDPHRDGLLQTPERVSKMYIDLLSGYSMTPEEAVGDALFDYTEARSGPYDLSDDHSIDYGGGLVSVCHIPFASLCEHHMLPFKGVAHVGYLPQNQIIGLSKIPRVVDVFARRLQVQERLTHQVCSALDQILNPRGVMVIFEGTHACASLRGVNKQGMNMVTRSTSGVFARSFELQASFERTIVHPPR
jgi:GTP cyclohydrolase IA